MFLYGMVISYAFSFLKQVWDQAPDLYGIRRSGRSRREIVRYNVGVSLFEIKCRIMCLVSVEVILRKMAMKIYSFLDYFLMTPVLM